MIVYQYTGGLRSLSMSETCIWLVWVRRLSYCTMQSYRTSLPMSEWLGRTFAR